MAPMIFAKSIYENRPINIFNYGKMQRDFTYIDDIVSSLLLIINKPATSDKKFDFLKPNPATSWTNHRIFNIGNSSPTNLEEYINVIENNLQKKAIREYVFSDVEQAYRSTSVSVLASHLIDVPKQLSMITGNEIKPEQFAFFLNSGTTHDGKLAVFHSIRDEKIAGWTMYETQDGDKFHSITALNDKLFVVVKRVMPSGTKYLLEKSESNLFNCGYGNGFSVLDVVNTANKICQNKINYKFSERRDGDVEKLIAETSKISKHIQWQPKYNDLEEIINSSIKWEEKINARNS